MVVLSESSVIVFLHGLGNRVEGTKILIRYSRWSEAGYDYFVPALHWSDGQDFSSKLASLETSIRDLSSHYQHISVIGLSAGGSLATILKLRHPQTIEKAINVCGRLTSGSATGFRSLKNRSSTSPAFRESVQLCESLLQKADPRDLAHILTLRPRWGDELVPATTAAYPGLITETLPFVEHGLTIALALTLFSPRLKNFLRS